MKFLQGKKTYISAAVLFAIGVYGIWAGLDSEASLAAIGLALTVCGLGAKTDRYAQATQIFVQAAHKHQVGQPLTAEERSALLKAGIAIAGDVNAG